MQCLQNDCVGCSKHRATQTLDWRAVTWGQEYKWSLPRASPEIKSFLAVVTARILLTQCMNNRWFSNDSKKKKNNDNNNKFLSLYLSCFLLLSIQFWSKPCHWERSWQGRGIRERRKLTSPLPWPFYACAYQVKKRVTSILISHKQDKGVKVVAIGVGPSVDNKELNEIAMGQPDNVVHVKQFDQLVSKLAEIVQKSCAGKKSKFKYA